MKCENAPWVNDGVGCREPHDRRGLLNERGHIFNGTSVITNDHVVAGGWNGWCVREECTHDYGCRWAPNDVCGGGGDTWNAYVDCSHSYGT